MQLYLASQSPRRRELLATLDVEFKALSVDIDESVVNSETPNEYVKRLAIQKATAGLNSLASRDDAWVLGSDTSVVIDDFILGKPISKDDFVGMMNKLSGQIHSVYTSIALVSTLSTYETVVETKVKFCDLSKAHIDAYWDSGEPCDKAGGYGIQGLGSIFVERIEGSYSSVVGLPLRQTAQLLSKAGLPIWNGNLCL